MRTFNSRQNCWPIKTRKIKTFSDQAKLWKSDIIKLFCGYFLCAQKYQTLVRIFMQLYLLYPSSPIYHMKCMSSQRRHIFTTISNLPDYLYLFYEKSYCSHREPTSHLQHNGIITCTLWVIYVKVHAEQCLKSPWVIIDLAHLYNSV